MISIGKLGCLNPPIRAERAHSVWELIVNVDGIEVSSPVAVMFIILAAMALGLALGVLRHGLPPKKDPYSQAKIHAKRQALRDNERRKRVKTIANILGRAKNALRQEATARGYLMQESGPLERDLRGYLNFFRGRGGPRVSISIEPGREGKPVRVWLGNWDPIEFQLTDPEVQQAIDVALRYIKEN